MNDELIVMIVRTLRELNEQQKVRTPEVLDGDTPLFGRDGILDSLRLVSLVVAVEQAIEDEFGANILLADEKAMSQKNSPYRTIGSLAEYANRLLVEEKCHG